MDESVVRIEQNLKSQCRPTVVQQQTQKVNFGTFDSFLTNRKWLYWRRIERSKLAVHTMTSAGTFFHGTLWARALSVSACNEHRCTMRGYFKFSFPCRRWIFLLSLAKETHFVHARFFCNDLANSQLTKVRTEQRSAGFRTQAKLFESFKMSTTQDTIKHNNAWSMEQGWLTTKLQCREPYWRGHITTQQNEQTSNLCGGDPALVSDEISLKLAGFSAKANVDQFEVKRLQNVHRKNGSQRNSHDNRTSQHHCAKVHE